MIVGMMAISDCPITTASALKLSRYCDQLIFRYDVIQGNLKTGDGGKFHSALFRQSNLFNIPVEHFDATTGYKGGTFWREELLERSHKYEPEVCLLFDSDEIVEDDDKFLEDLRKFRESDAHLMLFNYEMATSDGRKVPKTPHCRHCKAFKWSPGMSFFRKDSTYLGDGGFGKPLYPGNVVRNVYVPETKMMHYSLFSPEAERIKMEWYASFKSPGAIEEMFKYGGVPEFDKWYIEHTPPETYWNAKYVASKDRASWRNKEIPQAAKIIFDEFNYAKSVVDFGAANGLYLKPFQERGDRVLGIEGSSFWFPVLSRELGFHNSMVQDLRVPFNLARGFDLGISFEVLEHLYPYFADTAVRNIVSHSKEMIITASKHHGKTHFNVKPLEYWIEKFENQGAKYNKERSEHLMKLFRQVDTRMKWLHEGVMVYE